MGQVPRVVAPLTVALALAAGAVRAWAAGADVSYTTAQAAAGAKAYAASCARCHGARLDGGMGPPLKGTLAPFHGTSTVGDVYTYVRTQMPLGEAGSLKGATYVAIVAYLLQQNGHRPGTQPLSAAAVMRSTRHI